MKTMTFATALLTVLPFYHPTVQAQTVAITGGTVFPVSGARIQNGTVLIRDGRITAVGANIAIPAGATRIDASGKWVTPGLFHAAANAGLGVAGLNGFGESRVQGDINPSFDPTEGIDPAAFDIPIVRTGGVTGGLLPASGGLFPGQAVAITFSGDRLEDLVIKRRAALILDLSSGTRGAGGGSRAGVLARVRRLFNDALEYSRRKADYQKAQIQELSAPARELEALLPALRGEQVVVIAANRRMDIENSLRIIKEYRLKGVLYGVLEGWQAAKEIAAAKVPVIVEPLTDIPSFDGLGARLDNVTLLREAGADVIIAQGDPGGERNLRYAAGNAVRNGMTWDDALRSITAAPTAVFGLNDYGTLESGKIANVVVWSGDPFDFSSAAEHVLIRGQEVSLKTRETELRDKYRTLPLRP